MISAHAWISAQYTLESYTFPTFKHDSKTIQDRMHREIWLIVYFCLFLILWYFIDMRRAANSRHSLILIFIVVFYWHAESCQFAAFIINPIFFSPFRDGYYFKELNHGSIQSFIIWNFEWCHYIWEANIVSRSWLLWYSRPTLRVILCLYLPSSFYLSNFRIKVLWITVIMDGFSRHQWNNIDGMVYFILFDGTEQSCWAYLCTF